MSTFMATPLDWYADPNIDVDNFAPTGTVDIDSWLDAVVAADMTYAALTVKHHDGFCIWPTAFHVDGYDPYSIAQTAWYAANGSPDIVSLFVTKCRTRGLNPVLYFSLWDLTYEIQSGTDQTTDAAAYIAMIEAQLTELLTNYGDIAAIWIDGWSWHLGYNYIPYPTIAEHIRSLQPNCLVIENSHTHPTLTSDIEIYEPAVGDGSIASGNTRLSEEVVSSRVDGAWFANESFDSASANYTAAATVLAAIANANNNNATYMLGIAPNKAGVLPAALVTRLGQLGV